MRLLLTIVSLFVSSLSTIDILSNHSLKLSGPSSLSTSSSFPFEDIDNISDLNSFFEQFFYRENTLTLEEWNKMLPTKEEIGQMRTLMSLIYGSDSAHPLVLSLFPALSPWLDLTVFKGDFYVVHEKLPPKGSNFARGWGYVVIGKRNFCKRNIHHSAAHFESDGPVCDQAASLFEASKSRSLVVAGASRYAVRGNSSTPCQKQYTITDVAHAIESMFNNMNVILKDLTDNEAKYRNRTEDAVFIQWHGMAEISCLSSYAFVSAGLPNNSIYDSDIPATRIALQFNNLATTMNATTPRQDNICKLTAGSNVFGRYVNGVKFEETCHTAANPQNVTGQFVHIEQKRAARDDISLWREVLFAAFPIDDEPIFKKRQFSHHTSL